MSTQSRFDKEEYKKTIENYSIWDDSIKNWENARDDPRIRQKAGIELYNDKMAYSGTPADQFRASVIALRNQSTSRFANQTRDSLDTILTNIISKIPTENIVNVMLNMPVYEAKGELKESAEAHENAKEATEAYKTDNVELMKAYIMEIVDDELKPAVAYHAANNPHFKEIFQRGILRKAVSDFAKTFQKKTEGKKKPQWNKEKIQNYLKLIAEKTTDNNELAKYFVPLTAGTYSRE